MLLGIHVFQFAVLWDFSRRHLMRNLQNTLTQGSQFPELSAVPQGFRQIQECFYSWEYAIVKSSVVVSLRDDNFILPKR